MKNCIPHFLAASLAAFLFCGASARAARGQGIDLEAAKREGELVFYSAMRAEDSDQMVKAFTKPIPVRQRQLLSRRRRSAAAEDLD